MRSVSTPDGRTLSVREGGDPQGVPMVVLHGTPGSGLLYEPHLRDAEQRGIRLISYDRPGFGGSTRDKGRDIADGAGDISTICDALGVERVCVWGISGGAPHALAAAALLPDRVVACAALAAVAPYDAEGLDFTAGMGEQNVEEFANVVKNEAEHLAGLKREREGLLAAKPDDLVEAWRTLLGPCDLEIASGRLAGYLLAQMQAGLEAGYEGWADDDIVFVWPWGFELASIHVPILHWHGRQDRFVPVAHAEWLAARIPGVDSRITAEDGHLTLFERRIPEVHAWLLERFH
ncbi:MAG TPA: alpha/beta hydrolase [Gaiellaceae bacterium]|jgi:pimeloyl-ACP methyl ester carboxylesterase